MMMRAILCSLLAVGCCSVQAGGLPIPKKRVLIGGAAVVLGVGVIGAAKKRCTSVVDPDTGLRRPHCEGVDVDGIKEKAGEAVATATTSLSNYKLKRALNRELGATGEPPNPNGCEAHHIVPRGENRMWARDSANTARAAIDSCVDIDSAENGIYLPVKENAQCVGRTHLGLHKKQYYESIAVRLADARRFGGCHQVRQELLSIKGDLARGAIP